MKVLQYPLTQITLFFVCGILFNRYLNFEFNIGLILLVTVFSLFLICFAASYRSKNKVRQNFFTISTFLLAFATGIFSVIIHQDTGNKNHYTNFGHSDGAVGLKVTIVERWKSTAKNDRFVAEVYSLNDTAASGKMLINFRKEKTTSKINIGLKLALFAKIIPLQKPLNPDQFDYSSFLKNKSIYGQIYTDESSLAVFSSAEKSIYYYSAVFRDRVIANLKNSGFNQKELAVVSALILGQRQDLDPTVLQNYQFAGAVHILSVSGLHVGFVLLFLNYFLNFLPNTSRFRIFKTVLIIFVLWSFALVAGFSPSVVRSVTMFSFVAIGMFMRRKTYIFYTFYCSIFLILLFEPSFLFDVGFQLSYMALFFILWLQPEFEKLWQPKFKVVNYFWQVLTITFAAQLGTMPLSLYYFHQFPGLFFVTNLLIMFLITVIMGVGLFVVLIAFCTEIPTFISKILEKLIWLLNYIVEQIASFESFIFRDISFNFWMMASLYAAVFALGWFCIRPNFKTTVVLLSTVVLFQISFISFDFNSGSKEEFIVFQARNSSLILERKGKEISVFSNQLDTLLFNNDRTIQSFNVANGTSVKQVQKVPNLMFFHDKKILVLDSSSVFAPGLNPNILVVTQSPKINFERVLRSCKPEIVIVDASNYKNVVEKIRKTCNQEKIPFHAVAEKGFYRIE